MPTKNLSIMFTDIKGFTARTAEAKRKTVIRLINEHKRLLLPVFSHFEGTVVKTIGDAFLVRFDSSTDAVICGLTIQEVLRKHNAFAVEKDKLAIRVAINVGDVELKDGDVIGEVVNVASRLEGITDAGEVYFTEAVYLAMNRKEVPSTEVGDRTFKGIPYPIKVYKVIRDPQSDQWRNIEEAVRLTREGPVIQGLKETVKLNKKTRSPLIVGAMIMVGLMPLLWFIFSPSEAEKAIAQGGKLLASGEGFTTLKLIEAPLRSDPENPDLRKMAIDAARIHIEYLKIQESPEAALNWLRGEMEQKTYLSSMRSEEAVLDTDVTLTKQLAKEATGREINKTTHKLIDSYPDNPHVPYLTARRLHGIHSVESCLWLYEEAQARGGYEGDDHIFQACTEVLSKNKPGSSAGYAAKAHRMLKNNFGKRRLEWADKALVEGNLYGLLNAMHILNEKQDKKIQEPYYQSLQTIASGLITDEACEVLYNEKDAARHSRAILILKELLKKNNLKTKELKEKVNQIIERLARNESG